MRDAAAGEDEAALTVAGSEIFHKAIDRGDFLGGTVEFERDLRHAREQPPFLEGRIRKRREGAAAESDAAPGLIEGGQCEVCRADTVAGV